MFTYTEIYFINVVYIFHSQALALFLIKRRISPSGKREVRNLQTNRKIYTIIAHD